MARKLLLFLLILSVTIGQVSAMEDSELLEMERMSNQLKSIAKDLQRGEFDGNDLPSWTKLTIKLQSQADLCVAEQSAAINKLKTLIESLGEKVKGEDSVVTRERKNYKRDKERLDKILAKCNLYIANSEEVSAQIKEAEKSYFQQKYLARSPDILTLAIAYLENPFDMFIKSGEFLFDRSGIRNIGPVDLVTSLLAIVIAVIAGVSIRRSLNRFENRHLWKDHFTGNFSHALVTTLAAAAPYLLGSAVAALSMLIVNQGEAEMPFLTQLFIGLFIFFSCTTLVKLLFSPVPPATLFIGFTPHIADSLSVRLRSLAVLGLVGYLAFYTVFAENIIETHLLFFRGVFSLFFVANLVWTLKVIISSPNLPRLRYVAIIVLLVVAASLVAEWLGYRNLAFGSRRLILLAFITFLVFIGLSRVFTDLFDAVDKGSYGWARKIHKSLGVEPGNRVPGLVWLRLLTSIMIWGSFAFLLINAWDYSGGLLETIRGYLVNGFDIGEFRIVPSRLLWAILIFSMVIILSGWMRSQLENNWLKMTGMDQGARDALVTITGYVMFIVAFMVGLSAAGFDFGNLAIIAGALSVGIGFGLQNIVNNFVSGLILLFERPIRKGDWIAVGTTEGHVKEIQIRSTRIQTFDRSDVIVPNSELISNQVSNWVLSNRSGRACIPIGVAYGSDTAKVRDILLEIAETNPDVDRSGFVPKPVVLFRQFGDSSLNFELRVFLKDIESRLQVISDINFAIDMAFRENNIEIPFPQRDLHVRSMPPEYEVADEAEPGAQNSTVAGIGNEPADGKDTGKGSADKL